MDDHKILNTEQINWYEDGNQQLDYQLVFDENGCFSHERNLTGSHRRELDNEPEDQVDIEGLLRERDNKWKKRIQNARQMAFAKGLKQGEKQGYERATEEINEKVNQLEQKFNQAHTEWLERQKALDPGLIDLAFDIAESILGIPVENPQIRRTLEEELSVLLHEVENQSKPVLWVSESDYRYVEKLVEKYASELSVSIRIKETCNPGEFEFETNKEMIVYRLREVLGDFREKLSLPSWK